MTRKTDFLLSRYTPWMAISGTVGITVFLVSGALELGWAPNLSWKVVVSVLTTTYVGLGGFIWAWWTSQQDRDMVLFGVPCVLAGCLFGQAIAPGANTNYQVTSAAAFGVLATWTSSFWVGHLRSLGLTGARFVAATEAIRPPSVLWFVAAVLEFVMNSGFQVPLDVAPNLITGLIGLAAFYLYLGPGLSQYTSAVARAREEAEVSGRSIGAVSVDEPYAPARLIQLWRWDVPTDI